MMPTGIARSLTCLPVNEPEAPPRFRAIDRIAGNPPSVRLGRDPKWNLEEHAPRFLDLFVRPGSFSFMPATSPPNVPPVVAAPGYGEYEIDIEEILRQGLPTYFATVGSAPLTAANVDAIPARAKGAYMLLLDGHPVYAGKTDTRHGFRDRLGRHYFTVQHRVGLDVARISFKAVRILVFSSFDVEALLIQETRKSDPTALRWNDRGFGSNDPGRNREIQEPADFDKEFPVDIDRPLDFLPSGATLTVHDALMRMKEGLPYLLRYETDLAANGRPSRHNVGHAEARAAAMTVPAAPATARTVLQAALDALPAGWQATVFPDRLILYREARTYRYAREVLRRA